MNKRTIKVRLGDLIGWNKVRLYIAYLKHTEMDNFCKKNFKRIKQMRREYGKVRS